MLSAPPRPLPGSPPAGGLQGEGSRGAHQSLAVDLRRDAGRDEDLVLEHRDPGELLALADHHQAVDGLAYGVRVAATGVPGSADAAAAAGLQRHGGLQVPDVVQPGSGESGRLAVLVKQARDGVRVEGLPRAEGISKRASLVPFHPAIAGMALDK